MPGPSSSGKGDSCRKPWTPPRNFFWKEPTPTGLVASLDLLSSLSILLSQPASERSRRADSRAAVSLRERDASRTRVPGHRQVISLTSLRKRVCKPRSTDCSSGVACSLICPHCTASGIALPHTFPLERCERAIAMVRRFPSTIFCLLCDVPQGQTHLLCPQQSSNAVRVDRLFPDLDLMGAFALPLCLHVPVSDLSVCQVC